MKGILGFLIPTEVKFFDLLKKQSENVLAASEEFSNFVKTYNKLSSAARTKIVHRIKTLENKGDSQTYEIIETLNRCLVTPFDREDIHELTVALDDVLDLMDSTSRKLLLYKIKKVSPVMVKQAELLHELVRKIHSAVGHLHSLKEIKQICEQIYSIENKADVLYEDAISDLFENGADAREIIKFKDIHSALEDIFDRGKRIADTLQTIVVKHS